MTKVSIITVTYNSAATLSRTLRSIEQQTYPEIEHILIDGESADATMPIIHDYASRHDNVRYVSEKDRGIYDAINKGIKMATGEIIGILNSDDTLASNETIAHIVKTFEETGADLTYGDLVYCRYTPIERQLHVVRNWVSNDFDPHSLRFGWMCPHPTLYLRRKVYDEQGLYKPHYRISADYDFILRVFSKKEYKKAYIPEVLINMEIGGVSNRDLRSMARKTREDIRVLKENGQFRFYTILAKNLRKIGQFFH